jgi:RNA polymerase sigma factor (sigma-70 family)
MPATLPDQSELKQWLAAVALRDRDAFRRLYDATSPKLFGFALRILKKDEWAEEALQDAFLSIWNNAAQYRPHLAAPVTWMAAIVRNKALDMLRRRDDDVEIGGETFGADALDAFESHDPTPYAALQVSQDARALAHCLGTLEGLHRQAIAMAFFHDLSHTEVAAQMSLPIGTIKTWIRRGLMRLQTCLAKMERA